MGFRYLTVMLTIVALSGVIEASWFRRLVRKAKKGIKRLGGHIKKGLKRVGNAIKQHGKKLLCKAGYLFVCPAAITAVGSLVAGGSGGTLSALVGMGAAAGTAACKRASKRCKRGAMFDPEEYVYVPFSHEFSNYDMNGDKLITYEEFAFAIMNSIPLDHPDELRDLFMFADANDDGIIEMDEFQGAPFIWDDEMFETDWSNNANETAVAA